MRGEYYETDSGLVIPGHVAVDLALAGARPKAVDFFCGCGGFSLGFIQAGYEVVAGIDNEACAAITYTMNLGNHPMQFHFGSAADRAGLEKRLAEGYKAKAKKGGQVDLFEVTTTGSGWISEQVPKPPGVSHFFLTDIAKLKGRQILDVLELEVGELDVVVGSPPCQGFSFANSGRNPDDPRNGLIFEFARLIVEMRPKAMCMENVPGIQSMTTPDGFRVLDVFTQILTDGDFNSVDAMRSLVKKQTGLVLQRGSKSEKEIKARRKRKRK